MATGKLTEFPFDLPAKGKTPLEERLERIAATGEITRSVATGRLPHKKAKDVTVQGRTVVDTSGLFVGSLEAATDRPMSAPVAAKAKNTENYGRKTETEAGPGKEPGVKRVFEPVYNWPCAYAKDRELRACPEEKLTTILFGEGRIAGKKKEKVKKCRKIEQNTMAIEPAPVPNIPMQSLPQYSSQRSSSLYNIRLREEIRSKVTKKLSKWQNEVESLLKTKKKSVEIERNRLKTENDKLVKDFEDMKVKFEEQKKAVENTLKALRGEKEREKTTEKEMEKEFDPELPPARYPKSKAVVKATADVERWFTDTVLAKHKLLLSTEQWTSTASPAPVKAPIDMIYLTEVHASVPSRPVFPVQTQPNNPLPRLIVEFHTPNDSFEDVSPAVDRDSDDSFEEIP